jgi:hypothetical protein
MKDFIIHNLLGIWGAGLSTILGISDLIRFRKDFKITLIINSIIEVPFDGLLISVVNNSSKPLTLTSFNISLGVSPNDNIKIMKNNINPEKKLSESDRWTYIVKKSEIIENLNKLQIQQKQFQRLLVSVKLSNGKEFTDFVYINPQIIQKNYYSKAEQYIATDLFLNFKQMESVVYPIGIK